MTQKHNLDYVLGNHFFEVTGLLAGEPRHYEFFATWELADEWIRKFTESEAGKNSDWSNFIIHPRNMVIDLK